MRGQTGGRRPLGSGALLASPRVAPGTDERSHGLDRPKQQSLSAPPLRIKNQETHSKPNSLIRGVSIRTGSTANSRLGSVSSLTRSSTARNS